MEGISKATQDQDLRAIIKSLEDGRAEWGKLSEAVKQCIKDLKSEDVSQRSLEKKLQKRDVKRKETDSRVAAEEQETQKKGSVGWHFHEPCSAAGPVSGVCQ